MALDSLSRSLLSPNIQRSAKKLQSALYCLTLLHADTMNASFRLNGGHCAKAFCLQLARRFFGACTTECTRTSDVHMLDLLLKRHIILAETYIEDLANPRKDFFPSFRFLSLPPPPHPRRVRPGSCAGPFDVGQGVGRGRFCRRSQKLRVDAACV